MPEINIHRPCKVIIPFLERSSQSEDEELGDMLLMEDPTFELLKREGEDVCTEDDLMLEPRSLQIYPNPRSKQDMAEI